MHHTGRYGQPPGLPCRHLEIADLAGLLQADQARPYHAGGFDGRPMHVVAAHFIGLSEHDVHILLIHELRIGQGLAQTAARIAMRLHGLHGDPRLIRRIHIYDYTVAPPSGAATVGVYGRGGGRRRTCRRPARSTPATNIISSQSKSPPPPLPAGELLAVTVSEADAVPELLPAGA